MVWLGMPGKEASVLIGGWFGFDVGFVRVGHRPDFFMLGSPLAEAELTRCMRGRMKHRGEQITSMLPWRMSFDSAQAAELEGEATAIATQRTYLFTSGRGGEAQSLCSDFADDVAFFPSASFTRALCSGSMHFGCGIVREVPMVHRNFCGRLGRFLLTCCAPDILPLACGLPSGRGRRYIIVQVFNLPSP